MTAILLAKSDYQRAVAAIPDIPLRNRFAEDNPVLNDTPVASLRDQHSRSSSRLALVLFAASMTNLVCLAAICSSVQ